MNESTSIDIKELSEKIQNEAAFLDMIQLELSKAVIGQKYMIERLIVALLSNGHVLLEGVPGLAKTLALKSLASTIHAKYSRIQFTPDLLPADITGTVIFNQKENQFSIRKGPIFANFILADEINRAPAKVQSALLEAMQEKQVTIGSETYHLEEPFLVMATQNPIEQEGTYPLPEAQLDRFMLKLVITYPSKEEERMIIRNNISNTVNKLQTIATTAQILEARNTVRNIYMDEKIEQYIIDIVFATRNPAAYKLSKLGAYIQYGASPRASINLALAAKAYAYIKKRAYVIPEDVKAIAYDVMRHSIGMSYEAEAENISTDKIISDIIGAVEVP
jgi:MoxR-like ATPase